LRETLANEVPESALDAEVARVVKAANKSTSSTRAKSCRHGQGGRQLEELEAELQ
jgi:hypothetical protein